MNYEELKHQEEIVRKSHYEYFCVLCKKKRTTVDRYFAKKRVCNSCAKKRIEEAFNRKNGNLFEQL